MLKLILSILVVCAFGLRDAVCWKYFPEMKTAAGEWDGSNELTMNFFAGIIFGMAIMNFLKTVHPITNYFVYLTICFTAFDCIDRAFRHYELDGIDLIFKIPIAGIISALYYAYKFRKKTTK